MQRTHKNRINEYLLFKQHLLPESKSDSIIQIAEDLCGLHATCPTTPFLSLFARMKRLAKSELITEIETNKSLIKTRSIRSTLHLLPVDRYLSVYAATRMQLENRLGQYIKRLGLTSDEFDLMAEGILIVLSGRGLTANEIKKETGHANLTNHIINILCDRLFIVRDKVKGGWKSNIHRYYRFEDFYKIECNDYQEEKALEDLVLSYIKTYGPAIDSDVVWWSGLKKTVVGDILEKKADKLTGMEISGSSGRFLLLKEDFDSFQQFRTTVHDTIHFLPAMDPYIMGYKNRSRFIDETFYDYVYDRFGNAAPTVILNGEMIGIWDIEDENSLVKFYLFKPVEDKIYEKIIESGLNTGKFYCDRDIDIIEVRSVIPVKELTVGSFMSPLKDVLKDV